MIRRLQDWQPRLIAYLHSVVNRPFVEGEYDCAIFAAGAVQAMTGEDLAAKWLGYASTKDGIRRLKRKRIKTHVDLAAKYFTEITPSFAQPGDVVAIDGDDIPTLGILQGARVYVAGPDRLLTVPRSRVLRAFSVPMPEVK